MICSSFTVRRAREDWLAAAHRSQRWSGDLVSALLCGRGALQREQQARLGTSVVLAICDPSSLPAHAYAGSMGDFQVVVMVE